MSYTAEQLRAKARNLRELGRQLAADDCEAHAAALEENARLTRECEFHARQCARVDELRHRAEAELAVARDELEVVRHGHRKVCDRMNNAEAELAKLRQHAEAMADDLDMFAAQPDYDGPLYGPMPSLIAYRADFPEGK